MIHSGHWRAAYIQEGDEMARARINLSYGIMLTMLAISLVLWSTPAVADDAAGTYKAKCAACHGADGKGETAIGKKMGMKDLASPEVQKMSDDELTTVIADGKDKMPSYKKSLKPEQIKDLVGYIRSLAKK
jgi:cytochrome c6